MQYIARVRVFHTCVKDFHPFLVHPKMVSLVVFEKSLEIKQFFAKMML